MNASRCRCLQALVLLTVVSARCALGGDSPSPTANAPADQAPAGVVSSSVGAPLTGSAVDIVKMQSAGLEKGVLQAFILGAKTPYKATVEDILYLHQNKVPDDLVREWVQKGNELNGAPALAAHSPDLAAHSPEL